MAGLWGNRGAVGRTRWTSLLFEWAINHSQPLGEGLAISPSNPTGLSHPVVGPSLCSPGMLLAGGLAFCSFLSPGSQVREGVRGYCDMEGLLPNWLQTQVLPYGQLSRLQRPAPLWPTDLLVQEPSAS